MRNNSFKGKLGRKLKKDLKTKKLKDQAKVFRQKTWASNATERIELMDELKEEKLFSDAIPLGEFFDISGVYYLFRDKKVVYIGESACVFTRISQHIQVKRFTHFKYIPLSGEKERKELERKLINKHRPVYNLSHNSSVTLKDI